MTRVLHNSGELASQIVDDCKICLAPDYSGCSIATILELIRQERRNLHIIGVPQMGLQADLLIGAGCVKSIDAASITMGEFGQAPRFVEAFTQGTISMQDSTCPVIHAGLQASEKGIPFMPLRGILGSDLVRHRDDWKVIDNPFRGSDTEDPILLVPAITPDIALFHAPLADRDGNVWIGKRRELMLMAHASRQVIVSVEKVTSENLLADTDKAAGVIPALYIDALAEVPGAADPVGLFGCYEGDQQKLGDYATAARTQDGFDQHLRNWLGDDPNDSRGASANG
ncbi:MAG: hypothetical protein KTR32_43550 [Granulosicoccus sp.]|nr:hypothetical protein [Granulosicoccus sp.]